MLPSESKTHPPCELVHWDCRPFTPGQEAQSLIDEARKILDSRPSSVMDKTTVAVSGDKHDYWSLATYDWPNPNTPDGLPYVHRDGETNPDVKTSGDKTALSRTMERVEKLAIAYQLTQKHEFSQKAARLLRVWFIDPQTRMNPNLEYAQVRRGIQNRGNRSGLIDGRVLISAINSTFLIQSSGDWSRQNHEALKDWFRAYLKWLWESPTGKAEGEAKNNHGTWYDLQVLAYAQFTGERELIEHVLRSVRARLHSQIDSDGRQPHELKRTRAWQYSTMNLRAWMGIALLAQKNAVDLWKDLIPAVDFLVDYASGVKTWEYSELGGFDPRRLTPVLMVVARYYPDKKYSELFEKLLAQEKTEDRYLLRVGRIAY